MSTRTETVVATEDGVQVSHVRLHSPLPSDFPEHPQGLNHLNYLRYRTVTGPADAAAADAVQVMHPGTWAGAQSLDQLARNVVRQAAVQGQSIEWWSLARRSDGATDLTGVHAAYAAGDPTLATGYYFDGKPLNGKIFEGFRRGGRQRYLAELGLQGAVLDQHELLVRELPDPAIRRAKVYCGGHSLGGLIAGAYAAWDLPGGPGHQQCAGLLAIDTLVATDPLGLTGRRWAKPLAALAAVIHNATLGGLRRGLIPRATPPGGTAVAQATVLLRILGVAAACEGDSETEVHRTLPDSTGWELFLRVLGARRYRDLWRRGASVRNLRFSGRALLGTTVGKGCLPIDPLQSNMGSLVGPTEPRRSFPVPGGARRVAGLRTLTRAVFGAPTAVPVDRTALYRWQPGGCAHITDIARVLAAGPLSTFEAYFPMRIHYDLWMAMAGARRRDLAGHTHTAGAAQLPTLHVLSDPDRFVPQALRLIRRLPPEAVHAPGYGHIDMVSGAHRPGEPVTTAIVEFLTRHVTPHPDRVVDTDAAKAEKSA